MIASIFFLLNTISQIQAQSADSFMVKSAMEESIDAIFKDFDSIAKPGAAVAVMK